MTRTMYDSTNVADDPAAADMVAYYIDGAFATTEATVRARFPHAVLVSISAVGTDAGICGDCEPGCLTVTEAVEWVKLRRLANADPSIYVNETYGWAPAKAAFKAAGVAEPHWWVADYDGVAVIPPGAVAKQYENPTLDHGHFDLSVAADYWPGVDDNMANIAQNDWDALIWRVDAILNDRDAVANGPTKGEKNALKARLVALEAQIAGSGGLTADQATELATAATGVTAIQASLKAGLKAT